MWSKPQKIVHYWLPVYNDCRKQSTRIWFNCSQYQEVVFVFNYRVWDQMNKILVHFASYNHYRQETSWTRFWYFFPTIIRQVTSWTRFFVGNKVPESGSTGYLSNDCRKQSTRIWFNWFLVYKDCRKQSVQESGSTGYLSNDCRKKVPESGSTVLHNTSRIRI
jgi:hypothetical protein